MMHHSKIVAIQSAETVAALRAATFNETCPAVRNRDYLAKNFLGLRYRMITSLRPQALLRRFIEAKAPGSYCFSIIRTRHFDQVLLEEVAKGIEQVVILGAGYDTRAFRYAHELKHVDIYELDFPGTQQNKKRLLRKVSIKIPDNLRFIPIDFNEKPFDQALLEAGFAPQKKTCFLWEGVSYYLAEPVVNKVLRFVSTCGHGSTILFDYATRNFVHGDHSTYGGKQVAKWLRKINEPFLFGLNADETASFLSKNKLDVVSDLGPDELERLYLTTPSGNIFGKTLGHVRMVHAQVK